MKPLSVAAYTRGSFFKMLPMTITVGLSVAILYFMSMFVTQLDTQIRESSIYPLENMTLIYAGKEGIAGDDIKNINANAGGAKCIPVGTFDARYSSIVGYSSAMLLMLQQRDLAPLMDSQGFKLIEGSLPQKPMEVLLHKKLAQNHGFKVGDTVKKGTKGWQLAGDVKISGIYEGRAVMGIGILELDRLVAGNPDISLAILGLADEDSLAAVNKYIDENFSEKYQAYTIGYMKKFMGNFNGPINAMKLFVGIILVGIIGIFLVNITTIQYTLRRKELELLSAIGYTRKYIIGKSMKEIGIAAVLGYLAGIPLAVFMGLGINMLLLSEKGIDMPLVLFGGMRDMLLVPLAIILLSLRIPLKLTKFKDLV